MKSKKNTYHHGNLRTAVLDAAHKLIESEGVQAITLRRIAREVGVSQNAPYSHFKDKSTLLDALATDGFLGLIDSMREKSLSGSTAPEHLQAIGKGYVQFALSQPELFYLMFDFRQTEKSNSNELQQASSESFNIVRSAVESVLKERYKNDDEVLVATVSAWALVHGLSSLFTENRLSKNPELKHLPSEDIVDKATQIFVNGLKGFSE